MDAISFLTQNRIFTHLGTDALHEIASSAQQRHFRSGEWIVHQGDVWPHLFMVKIGKVTAVKESYEGRSLILTTINRKEVFWGLAFFLEDAPMPAGLTATLDSELYLWSRENMLPLLLDNGRLAWELSCLIIQRVQLASEIVEKLAFQPVAGRLARLLMDQTGNAGTAHQHRDLTLDEMAARIGSTREVVSRFLHRFSDDGIISITRTDFSINDPQKLKDLAQKVKG